MLITDQAIYQSNMPFAAAMAVFLVLVTLGMVALTLLIGRKERQHEQGSDPSLLYPHRHLPRGAHRRRRRGSVNAKQSLNFPPQGFSLSWYGAIFTDPGWRAALFASVILALCAAALAVAIALPLAWFLWRRHAPWAQVFQLLGIAPFTLPPVITALGFAHLLGRDRFLRPPWTAVISHAIFFVTLPLVTLSLGFSAIDRSLVEAAATMGPMTGRSSARSCCR